MFELPPKRHITDVHFDKSNNGYEKLPPPLKNNFPDENIQELFDLIAMTDPIRRGENSSPRIDPLRVRTVIKNMNQLFKDNIRRKPTGETMLFGSTSNIDAVSYLNNENAQRKIDNALNDAITEGTTSGKDRNDVIEEIYNIIDTSDENAKTLPSKVKTKAEVVGFVLRMFNHPGGRIKIADLDNKPGSAKELGKWIETVFEVDMTKVGGSAAQAADLLNQLGEPKIIAHSQFSSPRQVQAFKNGPYFLSIPSENQIKITNKKDASNEDDPTKVNQVIERKANVSVQFEGRTIMSSKSDRFIFLGDYYDKDGKTVNTDPILPLPDAVLQQFKALGIKKFFSTTPTYLQRCKNDAEYKKFSKKLFDQFQILKQQGVEILYEFSGETTDIRYLKDVLKGNISSFSLNNAELIKLVEAIKSHDDFNLEVKSGSDPMNVYNNAVVLAKYLNVDRVHVHGHNIDISVRKNATKDDMKNEVGSLMYAKKIVTEWIRGVFSNQNTERNELSRLLKLEGYIDLLNFAEQLGQDSLIEKGYHQVDQGYSVAAIVSKWVYNTPEITTSSGDIVAIVAAIHALHKQQ